MSMSREQFEALVRRLEEYARRQPAGYRLRVGLLAALGYLYIFLVLAVLLGILALLGVALASGKGHYWLAKIGWIVVTLGAIILRAMWIRMPAPQGVDLRREEVPHLFAMIDELTSALRAPRFHHVLLDGDFNAAVVQHPKLGILGWQRNYLILGLPLMQALSPEQFRAVVAHELGHLSGNHSRFAGWIYRVEETWERLLERLQEDRHAGSFIFEKFFRWYAPYFSAYSFVLRRADEYVADRCAAELAGARNAATALANLAVNSRFLHRKFWPEIFRQADERAEPPAAAFAIMFQALRSGPPSEDASKWLEQALKEKTDYADTHPALSERLAALGYPSSTDGSAAHVVELLPPPAPAAESAARHYLGEAVDRLTERLNVSWREGVAPGWQERHKYAQESSQRLRSLEEKAQTGALTEEESWDRARWTAEFKGNEAAVPLLQEILARNPDHPPANYALGRILLEQEDATGIAYVEKAMEREPESVLPGCQLVYGFLQEQERADEAERYRDRAIQHYERLMQAQEERATLTPRDRFEPHGLPLEPIARLREQLSKDAHVGAAYLVRKVVSRFAEKPFYVLGIVPQYAWYQFHIETKDAEMAQRIASEMELPGEAIVVLLSGETKWLAKPIRKTPGAEVYRR